MANFVLNSGNETVHAQTSRRTGSVNKFRNFGKSGSIGKENEDKKNSIENSTYEDKLMEKDNK